MWPLGHKFKFQKWSFAVLGDFIVVAGGFVVDSVAFVADFVLDVLALR